MPSPRAAYNSSPSGTVIEVRSGTYGAQTSGRDEGRHVPRRRPGNKVRQLHNYASNVTFEGLDIDANGTHADRCGLRERRRTNVTFKNSRVGNVVDEKGALLAGWESAASMNLVIDNVEFHDVVQAGTSIHNECLFTQSPGLTVRNSTFRNCATMDMMSRRGDWWGQPSYGGITLENNVFGHSVNGRRLALLRLAAHGNMGQFENARIVNNTFENAVGGVTTAAAAPTSGVWANNIGGGWDCLAGITYRATSGKKCYAIRRRDLAGQLVRRRRPARRCRRCPSAGWTRPRRLPPEVASVAIDAGSATYAPAEGPATGTRARGRRTPAPTSSAVGRRLVREDI